ncbi:ROK family transcriptional regulator [Anditalea andensis]|uniref:ROK family transcriptional regulator n=1 Tax=Anditalea andensis TaxID=1048983 RepID=A0A074LL57_9BACT|nr:ROK family transcriptional regulator [Anditalea andensis]
MLGMDIGGTKIASAIGINGELYHQKKVPTPSESSQEMVLQTIVEHISGYLSYDFKEIGIGSPGLVDTAQGIIYHLANIPSFKEVNLKSYLENIFEVPVHINNDANCFVLGEHQLAQQYQHLVGITLGTGIGAGIIANGKLYGGHQCGAGEWGGASYLNKTYEDYCSGKFFRKRSGLSSKELFKLAQDDDPLALAVFQEFGTHVGKLVNQIMFAYAPEAIVLGGSISKAFPFFKDSLRQMIRTFPYKSISNNLHVYVSTTEDAAIYGAISLVETRALTDETVSEKRI